MTRINRYPEKAPTRPAPLSSKDILIIVIVPAIINIIPRILLKIFIL